MFCDIRVMKLEKTVERLIQHSGQAVEVEVEVVVLNSKYYHVIGRL